MKSKTLQIILVFISLLFPVILTLFFLSGQETTSNTDAATYMAHGYCIQWDRTILIYTVLGNLGIGITYLTIPFVIHYIIKKIIIFKGIVRVVPELFKLFITLCGIGHLIKVYNIWHNAYYLESIVGLSTFAVNLLTILVTVLLVFHLEKRQFKMTINLKR